MDVTEYLETWRKGLEQRGVYLVEPRLNSWNAGSFDITLKPGCGKNRGPTVMDVDWGILQIECMLHGVDGSSVLHDSEVHE